MKAISTTAQGAGRAGHVRSARKQQHCCWSSQPWDADTHSAAAQLLLLETSASNRASFPGCRACTEVTLHCLLSKHTLAGVWSSISHGCLIFLFGNDQNPQIEALTCYFHDFSELKVCSHPSSSYFSHPPHITASPAWLIHTPSSHFSKHQEKPHCSILYLSCISKAAIPCMCIQTAGFVAMYEHRHILLSLDIEGSRVPETGLCETYL